MTTQVNPIPEGREGVNAYLCVRGASKAIEFYKAAFGATELYRLAAPAGVVGHAELSIAGGTLMLSDEFPEYGAMSPQFLQGSPVTLCIYVEDVDAVVSRAVAAGAKVLRPVQDQFYGDRSGSLEDPFGHKWNVATHREDVSPEEMQRRFEATMKNDESPDPSSP